MPAYRYIAVDPSGRQVQGDLQVDSLRDASQALAAQNLKVIKIEPGPNPPTASLPLAQAAASRSQAPLPTVVRTAPSTYRQLFLTFSQLASYLRSGVPPQQAFSDLASRAPSKAIGDSFLTVKEMASQGKAISDGLELYPDLYPPHVVGVIRAGEQGGFLPDAASQVAQQTEESMNFERPFWWVRVVAISSFFILPIAWALVRAALDTWGVQDRAGGSAPGLAVLLQESKKYLTGTVLPLFILFGLVLVLGGWLWKKTKLRQARHTLAFAVPLFRKRAIHEGSTTFTWALSNLAKAGVLPFRAWALAVECVPNVVFQNKLRRIGKLMGERTPLSKALKDSHAFPKEYAMIVQTGEMTGSVPQALMDAAKMSRAEFEVTGVESKRLVRSWGCLLSAIGWIAMMYLLYRIFYPAMIDKVTNTEDVGSVLWMLFRVF
jgi:general secretion pathway protein F